MQYLELIEDTDQLKQSDFIKKCDSFITSAIGYSFIFEILGTHNFMN